MAAVSLEDLQVAAAARREAEQNLAVADHTLACEALKAIADGVPPTSVREVCTIPQLGDLSTGVAEVRGFTHWLSSSLVGMLVEADEEESEP